MLTDRLCKACDSGDVVLVEQLLASGASPNFASSLNGYRYPLHFAAERGHIDIVKILLQNDAAVDPLESSNAWTPLTLAALKSTDSPRHVDVILILLEAGADVEITDARGNTVVHILASLGQTRLIKQLLELFPSLDILGPGFGYLTPLHYAVEAGHIETVEFLLKNGADPRGIDASGWTPLHWACRRGHKGVIDQLLYCGGSIQDRDFRSLTPLDVAFLFGHAALAKLLEAQMPDSSSTPLALPQTTSAGEESVEVHGSKTREDVVCSALIQHSESQKSPTTVPEAAQLGRCRLTPPDRREIVCWSLGLFIVAFSVYDYVSRASLAALVTAAVLTFQDIEPSLISAAILAYASVFLPSIAVSVCCGSHLTSMWSWAGWRAANACHLFAGSSSGKERGDGRRMRPLLGNLSAVQRFNRLCMLIFPSGRVTVPRVAAAGCVFPLAAVGVSLLLWMQAVGVVVAASLTVATMWAFSALGLLVSKALILHQGGLLRFLDCLTHGSAVQLIATDPCLEQGCGQHTFKRTSPTGGKRIEEGCLVGHEYLTKPSRGRCAECSPDPLSPSHAAEGLRTIGEDEIESQSVSINCGKPPSDSICHIFSNKYAENVQHCTNSGQLRRGLQIRPSAFYSKATLYGWVPRQLHPCCGLSGAILLHRQHLKSWRDRHCLLSYRESQIPDSGGSAPVPSGSSEELAAEKPGSYIDPSATACGRGGWLLHGSSGGLFADSVRSPLESHTNCPHICDEVKRKFWSSGLEAGSGTSNQAVGCSLEMSVPIGGSERLLKSSDVMSFAYASSLQGDERIGDSVTEGSDALASYRDPSHSAAHGSGWNDKNSLRTESVAFLMAGLSPFRWMRRQTKRQQDTDTSCPQISPSIRTYTTQVSKPGIQNVPTWSSTKPALHLDTQNHTMSSVMSSPPARRGGPRLKLLFAPHQIQDHSTTLVREGEEDKVEKPTESPRKIQVLRKRRRGPVAAELDDREYDDLVLRREQQIFNWFEQIITLRYAEVKRKSETLAANIDGSELKPSPDQNDALSPDAQTPAKIQPPARNIEGGIKWSSFESLFPDSVSVPRPSTEEVGKKSEVSNALASEAVTCMKTEDLFDLPVKDSRMSQSLLLSDGKRMHDQQPIRALTYSRRGRLAPDWAQSAFSSKGAELKESDDTCGGSTSQRLSLPFVHYRFKDMVELPHLREVRGDVKTADPIPRLARLCISVAVNNSFTLCASVRFICLYPFCFQVFFSFWCREFEKLLAYQDQHFGKNPLWRANVLEEDSISAFSQGCLSSASIVRQHVAASPNSPQGKQDPSSNSDHDADVLWLLPTQLHFSKENCASFSNGGKQSKECGVKIEGQSSLFACQELPKPPMVCAVAVDLRQTEISEDLTKKSKKKRFLSPEPIRRSSGSGESPTTRSARSSDSESGLAEASKEAPQLRKSGIVSRYPRGSSVLVAEVCRFMFSLALTLDLLLGLCPLVGALLCIYFFPPSAIRPSSEVPEFSNNLESDCADAALGPTAFPGGYLFAPRTLSSTATLCALHLVSFWNLVLTLLVSLLHASLLFGQAAELFFPVRGVLRTD